jgi:hypothetical protein
MSPEQLQTLHTLSQLFEEGVAGPHQIKQLSVLLTEINQHKDLEEFNQQTAISDYTG